MTPRQRHPIMRAGASFSRGRRQRCPRRKEAPGDPTLRARTLPGCAARSDVFAEPLQPHGYPAAGNRRRPT